MNNNNHSTNIDNKDTDSMIILFTLSGFLFLICICHCCKSVFQNLSDNRNDISLIGDYENRDSEIQTSSSLENQTLNHLEIQISNDTEIESSNDTEIENSDDLQISILTNIIHINSNIILANDILDTKDECIICSDELKEHDIRIFKCFHIFHKNCIDDWFIKKKSLECPICNIKIDNYQSPD